jgi:hypothetical protein
MPSAMLRATILRDLRGHGIEPAPGEEPSSLREKLNDLYLEDVRRLKARQQRGEIPLREYAGHVQALKERYPLLGVSLSLWTE